MINIFVLQQKLAFLLKSWFTIYESFVYSCLKKFKTETLLPSHGCQRMWLMKHTTQFLQHVLMPPVTTTTTHSNGSDFSTSKKKKESEHLSEPIASMAQLAKNTTCSLSLTFHQSRFFWYEGCRK
jgi:hypothetical protein